LMARRLGASGFPEGEKRWPAIDPLFKFTAG
jgi:hypothetical protein